MLHSKIGASSYHRWGACPGSVKLSEGIVTPESDYAKEGTAAHDLAAQLLEYLFYLKPRPNYNEWPEDMYEHCDNYATIINQDFNELVGKPCYKIKEKIMIEHKFDLSFVHPGMFGTADCVIYAPEKKSLHVYDFKYGQGIAVEPANNKQLLYYALGCLHSLDQPCRTVELIIIQPRAFHPDGTVRRWETDTNSIIDFEAQLKQDALATERDDAPLQAGDHCRFCPASGICPALHTKALEMASTEFNSLEKYDADKLSKVLDWLPRLEAWAKSVREFAYSESQQGRTIPGYKLVAKRPTRKWVRSEKEIIAAFPSLDSTDFYEQKMKSPAKVEKMLDKADKELLNAYIEKKSSGTTLVPDSDKRPGIEVGPASEFKKLS